MAIDPSGLVATVATGAAGTLLANAAGPATRWLAERFRGHRQIAAAKARENGDAFLEKLGAQIQALEEAHPELKEHIETALDDPAFSVLLQEALLTAAQTSNREKQDILASIVAGRLGSPGESLFAMCSRLAVEAVAHMNERHLRLLGLFSLLWGTRPSRANESKLTYNELKEWLLGRLTPCDGLTLKPMDLLHLESLSCVQRNVGSVPLPSLFQAVLSEDSAFDLDDLQQTSLGAQVLSLWDERGVSHYRPTSIGNLIGAFVFDHLHGTNTVMLGWD